MEQPVASKAYEFEGSKQAILLELLELAKTRPPNTVWYQIEHGSSFAANTVHEILNKHMYRSDDNEESLPRFADFIIRQLEEQLAQLPDEAGEITAEANADSADKAPKNTSLDVKIKRALGRGSVSRRQWSNRHSRPRK